MCSIPWGPLGLRRLEPAGVHKPAQLGCLSAAVLVLVGLVVAAVDRNAAPKRTAARFTKPPPHPQVLRGSGQEVENDPLQSIVTLLGSPGDLSVIFDSMAAHAPDEIRADTEAARDAMKKEQEAVGEGLSDPLGALGKSLGAGLTSSGSFQRVKCYLNEHCPVNSNSHRRSSANRNDRPRRTVPQGEEHSCQQCGEPLAPKAAFCRSCGAKYEPPTPSEPAAEKRRQRCVTRSRA